MRSLLIQASSAASRVIRLQQPFVFRRLLAVPQPRVIADPAPPYEVEVEDRVMLRYEGATVANEVQLIPETLGPAYGSVSWESSDENVATVDDLGNVTYVSDGTVTISASIGGQTQAKVLEMTAAVEDVQDTFLRYATGTFARACCDAVDLRIAGKNPEVALPLFSSLDHATPEYSVNEECWLADLDTSLLPVWNSRSGLKRAGIPVSPDCFIFARHFPFREGDQMRYLSDDGTVTVRTVKDVRFPVSDIGVGIWSEPLPEGVGFAKVLPNDWQNCIGQSAIFNIPGLRLTQFKDAAVVNFTKNLAFQIRPDQTNPHRYSFYREAVLYDSGTGCFWIPNGEFILLMCLLGVTGGPFIADHKPVINSAMTALGSPYQLTEYDLSAFPTYD